VCIGISQFVVERLVCVNGVRRRRAVLVYNGINVAHFATPVPGALHALLGVPPATRVVFASGRAQAYKGIAVFIEAAARLESRGVRDVAFAYCGDGPDLDSFRRLAAARGLRTFHFLGRRDDMPRLLGSAAVAVAPALWEEAFGLTVVEAMAAGVPVVATAVGGVPELVEAGRSGLLVPPGEAAALADAIGRLLDDPSLRAALAAGGREAARRFDFDMAVQRLAEVLVARLPAARPTRGAAPR
jgi:glycosyltransferase involved in cell wall biosynthesis